MSASKLAATLACLGALVLSLATGTAAASAASPSSSPTLGQLPEIVAADAAAGESELAIDFSQAPDPTALRAGIAAASAVSGLSKHGVQIISVIGASARRIATAPVSVIRIDERPGATRISLAHLSHGNLLLTIAGQGQNLVNAAKVLSTRWLSALDSSSTVLSAALLAQVARLNTAEHGSESLRAGSVSADGTVSLTRQVVIPVQKVIDRGKAVFRMGVEYDAPGGGRLTFKLNGFTLGSAPSRGRGNTFVYREKIASVWTDGPNLQPGYYLNPGVNTLTITATPDEPRLIRTTGAQLALTTHSNLAMTLSRRRPQIQLDLWPFPLFNGSWSDTTVVTPPAASLTQRALSTLITALANTERLTGVAADPHITYAAPTAAQRKGNLLVFGNPETVAHIAPDSALVPGLVTERKLTGGGYALLATDAQGLSAFGAEYYAGLISGQTAVVDPTGQAHTIAGAPDLQTFATPAITWLRPAAAIAILLLAWIAVRVFLARRRLRARPDLPPGRVVS